MVNLDTAAQKRWHTPSAVDWIVSGEDEFESQRDIGILTQFFQGVRKFTQEAGACTGQSHQLQQFLVGPSSRKLGPFANLSVILSETEPAVTVFSDVLKVYAEEIHRAFQPDDTTTRNMTEDLLATELAKNQV